MLICPVCESIYPTGTYDRCPQDGAPLYVFGEGEADPKRFIRDICNPAIQNWKVIEHAHA